MRVATHSLGPSTTSSSPSSSSCGQFPRCSSSLFLLLLLVVVIVSFPFPSTSTCSISHLRLGDPLRLEDALIEEHHLAVDRLVEGQLLADEVLNALVQLHVVLRDQCHGLPVPPGASRPSHPVDVRLRVRGNVVVHHNVHVGNVQAAGGDVGGQQNGARLRLELVQ